MNVQREFESDGERLRVQLRSDSSGGYVVTVGDREYAVTARPLPDGRVRFEMDSQVVEAAAAPLSTSGGGGDVHVSLGDSTHVLRGAGGGRGRRADAQDATGDGSIAAPMTGTVLAIAVRSGDTVAATDTVAVLSAMKMEHKLVADVAGRVVEIVTAAGETVDQDQVILRIEPDSPDSSDDA